MGRGGREPRTGEEPVWSEEISARPPLVGPDEVPPLAETLLYAWQHTLVDVSPYVLPLIVGQAVGYSAEQIAAMISACLLMMGLATFVNVTWGNRLPSVLGPSATDTGAMATAGALYGAPAMWAAGFVGGLAEAAIGASGLLGPLRRLWPPYVCGIVVLAIALSLARVAGSWIFAAPSPTLVGLAVAAVVAILALTVLGERLRLSWLARGAILLSLLGCGLAGGLLSGTVDLAALRQAPWLGLPRPFAFGGPGLGWELAAGAVAGVLLGYLGSIAESIGDYAGTCAVAGIPYRLHHIRRGITVEGIASAVAPLVGGLPLTTYSQNTGVIATTRVASRRVIQVAALLLAAYGLCPKLGALLVLLPRPVVGAVFLVICGMIATVGLRLLASAAHSDAHQLTIAIALAAAVTLPVAAAASAAPWLRELPTFLRFFLGNGVVIAVTFGIGLNALLGWLLPE